MSIDNKSYTPETIGERIVQARELRGMSQADLARALGVPQTQISRYENNRARPRSSTLIRLANVLQRPIGWLNTGVMPQDEPDQDVDTERGIKIALHLTEEEYQQIRRVAIQQGCSPGTAVLDYLRGSIAHAITTLSDSDQPEPVKRTDVDQVVDLLVKILDARNPRRSYADYAKDITETGKEPQKKPKKSKA